MSLTFTDIFCGAGGSSVGLAAAGIAEQTMQAGNAVSANVAQWLGEQVTRALDGAR